MLSRKCKEVIQNKIESVFESNSGSYVFTTTQEYLNYYNDVIQNEWHATGEDWMYFVTNYIYKNFFGFEDTQTDYKKFRSMDMKDLANLRDAKFKEFKARIKMDKISEDF
jgi:hypothetical protein